MYINRYQRYMLDILQEYDCLKKSQLEFMVIQNVEAYLKNIDSYLNQLYYSKYICMEPCENDYYVFLPGRAINEDMIFSFDVMMEFNELIVDHKKGIKPVTIRFQINTTNKSTKEISIIPVIQGFELELERYANSNFSHQNDTIIFLAYQDYQLNRLRPLCSYSFAMKKGNQIIFYDGNL